LSDAEVEILRRWIESGAQWEGHWAYLPFAEITAPEVEEESWLLEDVLACTCGGRRRVLAMVHDRESIERILKHQGLPWKKPSRAPEDAVKVS
jgi:hypothetical protein